MNSGPMASENKNNRPYQSQNGAVPKSLPAAAQNYDLKSDKPRMVRLILESLEVALLLCNLFFDSYGLRMLFNIVNQILPTAFILNTGYWIYYSSPDGCSICICNRFGIRCPHHRRGFHWIDIDAMKDAEDSHLFSARIGKMYPKNFNIHIDPVINGVFRAFDINIRLTVRSLDLQGNKLIPVNDEITTLFIDARYILTPSNCPIQCSIVEFNPHPMSHPHYSRYFECLRRLNVFYSSAPLQIHVPRTHTIICRAIPNFTVITNNYASPNFHPTPKMNLPTWSGPFATPHGHCDEARSSTTHINQQYFCINYTNNAVVHPPYPPTPYTEMLPARQQVPLYSQFSPYSPTLRYQNRINNRQYAEKPRLLQLPLPDNASTKQKNLGKPTVPAILMSETNKLLPTTYQFPPAFQTNHSFLGPFSRQPSLSSTTNTQFSSLHVVATNEQAKFNRANRIPVHHDAPKPPEQNFLDDNYHNSFPELPAPNDFKKKPKLPVPTTKMTEETSDFDNQNIALALDPELPSTSQNIKSQKDTEASQMVQQSSDANCVEFNDMDRNELLNLVNDVIREDMDKDPPISDPKESDNFQCAHSNIEEPDNSWEGSPSPDSDCLYIDDYEYLDDDTDN